MTVWATAGILLVAALIIIVAFPRRLAFRNNHVQRRSDEHEAMVALFREWLDDSRIFSAIVSRDGQGRAPDASPAILNALYEDVGRVEEPFVRGMVAKILARKAVRRRVAHYMEREHNVPPAECRKQLGLWAAWEEAA